MQAVADSGAAAAAGATPKEPTGAAATGVMYQGAVPLQKHFVMEATGAEAAVAAGAGASTAIAHDTDAAVQAPSGAINDCHTLRKYWNQLCQVSLL